MISILLGFLGETYQPRHVFTNFSRATCQQDQMTPIHANEEDQNSDSRKLFTNVKSYANEQEKCS